MNHFGVSRQSNLKVNKMKKKKKRNICKNENIFTNYKNYMRSTQSFLISSVFLSSSQQAVKSFLDRIERVLNRDLIFKLSYNESGNSFGHHCPSSGHFVPAIVGQLGSFQMKY